MSDQVRATTIFVPTDFPVETYVNRADEKLENAVRDAFETPKTVISVSGPSKTGKTVLIQKALGEDNIIPIYGAQIQKPDDLWSAILNWIDVPASTTTTSSESDSINPKTGASVKVKVPGLAEGGLEAGVAATKSASTSSAKTKEVGGLAGVKREIGQSSYTVFLDDFHYIQRGLQEEIGRQIKAGTEVGIRFCVASVPHRSDDVVRSNHELRGRTMNIDTDFWNIEDLKKIGEQGFKALNLEVSDEVITRLAEECCTSPQIMQALCLQLCFTLGIRQRLDKVEVAKISTDALKAVLEQTSGRADYTSLLKQMHAGPRIRGTERKTFEFKDGSEGDAYRAALLAIAADPPAMEMNYTEITKRIETICKDNKPVGSSITESYKQIEGFARSMYPNQRIVEWDADAASGTLSIIDPYFLFFLRSSEKLAELGAGKKTPSMPLFDASTDMK